MTDTINSKKDYNFKLLCNFLLCFATCFVYLPFWIYREKKSRKLLEKHFRDQELDSGCGL